MTLSFMPRAWAQYLHWQASNPKIVARINALLQEASRSPFQGIGKPEPLRDEWSGWWSRRIDAEHRLAYRVVGKGGDRVLEIAQCRFHY
jgi:toxin YoeB